MKLYFFLGIFLIFATVSFSVAENEKSAIEKLKLNPDLVKAILDRREDILNYFVGRREVKPYKKAIGPECAFCIGAAGAIVDFAYNEAESAEDVGVVAKELCKLLQIVDDYICDKLVDDFIEIIWFILHSHNDPRITANDLCGFLLQEGDTDCRRGIGAWMTNWTISINSDKPFMHSRPFVPDNAELKKFLLLTDTHLDLHYHEGSVGNCNKPTCCRVEDDDFEEDSRLAGFWGDYGCDTPVEALLDIYKYAAELEDYEFVIFAGDVVHHVIWETSIEDNIDHLRVAGETLFESFPATKIYPVIGNHEPHPLNMFPTHDVWDLEDGKFSMKWMYDAMSDYYSRDLTPAAKQTFGIYGYYTQLHKPGFRVIVLNSNFCYALNFWLFYNPVDPESQLQWLADTLHLAELAKERVWLIGHEPPGIGDCWYYWNEKFNQIIDRFEQTIMAQFYGHTHNDDFKVFFDSTSNPPRPNNALFIGASGTAYTDINPGFKIYHAAPEHHWEVVNHETWVYNLTDANNNGQQVPSWYKLYDAKTAYNLRSLRPGDLFDLVERMVLDDTLFQDFYRFYHKDSNSPDMGPCDETCKANYLCSFVMTNVDDVSHCDNLANLIHEQNKK